VIVPELAACLRAVGQPVFHLQPPDPSLFDAARFPVFGADISQTGYYGFPLENGVVKIANHGAGIELPADADASARVVAPAHETALRAMLADSFPTLATAPIVLRRLCVYCDTFDEHFWIARDPARPNLAIATGGSGHAFKFAPVLGELIATLALGEPHALARKFRWRPELATKLGAEAARHHGPAATS
jgi:glycine/D-amino acid oxidase-like deaminating enzyme